MDKDLIKCVEKALNITLYPAQVEYLNTGKNVFGNKRQNGKTLAHCIALCISNGDPLDMEKPENFCDSDYGLESNKKTYARGYYSRMFYRTWFKLKSNGIRVRNVTGR